MGAHYMQVRVRFGELDPYNHVNHAVYLVYLEAGRVEALESVGMAMERMAAQGWQVVVADISVRFRAPAVAGDVLTVETVIGEVGAVTTRWKQRILRGSQVLVESELRAGSTGVDGRPKRLPPDSADHLRRLMADGV